MKEKENTSTATSTKSKKRMMYSIIIAVCALLLIAATVLTVYFVTNSRSDILEQPPIDQNPPDDQGEPENPDDPAGPGTQEPENPEGPSKPGGNNPSEDNKPSGGERVAYVKPVDSTECSVEYEAVYNNTSLDRWYKHMAIDYVAEAGTPVFAMADGVVKEISMESVLGNYIVLEHDGGLTTLYRFVEPVSNLQEGDTVKQGQTIATVAEAYGTEYKDGTHLHLEMKLNGVSVDPKDYIDLTLEDK